MATTPTITPTTDIAEILASRMSAAMPPAAEVPAPAETAPAFPAEPPAPEPVVEPAADAAPAEATPAAEEEEDFALDLDKDPAAEPEPTDPAAEAKPAANAPDPDIELIRNLPNTTQSRKNQLIQSLKRDRMLAAEPQPDGTGGIGHIPTVDQTVQYYNAFVSLERMRQDFQSGDPQALEYFAQHWLGAQNGQPTPSSIAFAAELPRILEKHNPEALKAMMSPVVLGKAEAFRQMASRSTNPDNKQRLLDAALLLEWDMGVEPKSSPAAPAAAPENSEIERLRRENEELRRSQAETQRRGTESQRQSFQSEIDESMDRALVADIDEKFKLKDRFGATPILLNGVRREIMGQIKAHVGRRMDLVNLAKNRAVTALDRNQVQNIVKQYRQVYAPVFAEKGPEILRQAGLTVKGAADAALNRAQQSAEKTSAPNGVSRPAPRDVALGGRPERLPNESTDDYINRTLTSRLSARLA